MTNEEIRIKMNEMSRTERICRDEAFKNLIDLLSAKGYTQENPLTLNVDEEDDYDYVFLTFFGNHENYDAKVQKVATDGKNLYLSGELYGGYDWQYVEDFENESLMSRFDVIHVVWSLLDIFSQTKDAIEQGL